MHDWHGPGSWRCGVQPLAACWMSDIGSSSARRAGENGRESRPSFPLSAYYPRLDLPLSSPVDPLARHIHHPCPVACEHPLLRRRLLARSSLQDRGRDPLKSCIATCSAGLLRLRALDWVGQSAAPVGPRGNSRSWRHARGGSLASLSRALALKHADLATLSSGGLADTALHRRPRLPSPVSLASTKPLEVDWRFGTATVKTKLSNAICCTLHCTAPPGACDGAAPAPVNRELEKSCCRGII